MSGAGDERGPGRDSRLPRAVLLLGWVSLFADVSSEMIYPLLPLFIVGALGAPAAVLGAIEGTAHALVAVLTAWSGRRSDRTGRRVGLVRWGYGLPVLGKAIIAAAAAWPVVLAGRLVDRFGKGLRGSPRDAIIAGSVPYALRGRAFGLHRAMDTAGAMIGVLLAALLLWRLTGTPARGSEAAPAAAGAGTPLAVYRTVFATAAALGLASLALALLVREPASGQERTAPPAPADAGARTGGAAPSRALPGLPGGYWRVLAPLLAFALANSSDAFVLLRAGQLGLSPWAVVLAYALYNFVYTIGSYPAGRLSDAWGRRRVIGAGWLLYAVVYAGLAVTGRGAIWPLLALYGAYMALTDGAAKALVADQAPAGLRGTALGLFGMTTGFAALLSSVIAGVLWDRIGPAAAFAFGAAAALLALLLLAVLARPRLASGAAGGPGPA